MIRLDILCGNMFPGFENLGFGRDFLNSYLLIVHLCLLKKVNSDLKVKDIKLKAHIVYKNHESSIVIAIFWLNRHTEGQTN